MLSRSSLVKQYESDGWAGSSGLKGVLFWGIISVLATFSSTFFGGHLKELSCRILSVMSVVYCCGLLDDVGADQRPVSPNQDKGLSRGFPVILAQFSLDSVSRKQWHISYHGDLFCAASLLQTRLTARLSLSWCLICSVSSHSDRKTMCFLQLVHDLMHVFYLIFISLH